MIWTDTRFRTCIEALEKAGLLDWSEAEWQCRIIPSGKSWLRRRYLPGERDNGTTDELYPDYAASALLERAAREWLEAKGLTVEPVTSECVGRGMWVVRRFRNDDYMLGPAEDAAWTSFDHAALYSSYARAQGEAMLAVLE